MKRVGKQRGFGHIEIFIIILVVVVAAGAGYWVWKKQKDNSVPAGTNTAVKDALKNVSCSGTKDKDLCKFFKASAAEQPTTIDMTTTGSDGKTSTILMKSEGTDKTYMKLSGSGMDYETITIGTTNYIKGGSTWYKQASTSTSTNTTSAPTDVKSEAKTTFTEPTGQANQPTYTKVGTEKVGNYNCLKYKVVDPSAPNTTTFMWFDNKTFQLRKVQYTAEGSTTTATFSYDKVTVSAPSPVTELGPNQYIMPGQSEPVTVPSSGDMSGWETLLNQAGQ